VPSRSDSEVIIRRLKAHGLVPEHVPARTASGRRGASKAGKVIWVAVDGSGRPLGVASYYPVRLLVSIRRWSFRQAGGVTYVEPGDG
jgi:hypothetical protein